MSREYVEAMEVQNEYLRSAYEDFVAQSTKLTELYSELAKEAYKPFEGILKQPVCSSNAVLLRPLVQQVTKARVEVPACERETVRRAAAEASESTNWFDASSDDRCGWPVHIPIQDWARAIDAKVMAAIATQIHAPFGRLPFMNANKPSSHIVP